MESTFTNAEISIETLPQFQNVSFNSISNRLRNKFILQNTILLFIVFGSAIGYYFRKPENAELGLFFFLIIGILIFILILRYVNIYLKQKTYGYSLRDKDVIFRSGYIVIRTIVIPYNRIQHVSIHRSFLDKAFKISSLKIYTAGGNSSDMIIPGLEPEIAIQINEMITQKISENE